MPVDPSQLIGLGDRGKQFDLDKSDGGVRAAMRLSADRARSFRDDPKRYKAE